MNTELLNKLNKLSASLNEVLDYLNGLQQQDENNEMSIQIEPLVEKSDEPKKRDYSVKAECDRCGALIRKKDIKRHQRTQRCQKKWNENK